MREVTDVVCAGVLCVLTWSDLKEKSVSILSIFISGMAFFVFRLCSTSGNWKGSVSGVFVGVLFLFISWISKQSLGYADSLIIMELGFYLGFWETLFMLGIAFLLSAFAGLFVLLKCRWSKKASIPFLPFLLIGYLGVVLK